MTYKNLFASFLVFFSLVVSPLSALAADSVPVHLNIEGPTQTIFNNDIDVSPCPEAPGSATSTINGYCAFDAAGVPVEASFSSFGAFVTAIGGVANDAANNAFWLWFLNGEPGQTGIDAYLPSPGDHVLWTITRMPLKISASTVTPTENATTTIAVSQFDPVTFGWILAPNAAVDFAGTSVVTDANGMIEIVATSTPFSVSAEKNGFLPSDPLTITPVPLPHAPHATISLRDGPVLVGPFSVELADTGALPVPIAATGATTTHDIAARSVLAALEMLDATSTEFDVSELQYFSSFNSFLVQCVTIPSATTTPLCGQWQYVVNGFGPAVGMDQTTLQDNDAVILYFGFPRQVALSNTNVPVGSSFTATAQTYDPATDTFNPTPGLTIGATQPDPNNPFSPIEVATSTADASGQAVFTLTATGTYAVGLQEDFYFPTTQIQVVDIATSTATSTPDSGNPNPPSTTGGGGGGPPTHPQLNTSSAFAFIATQQNANGPFDAPVDDITDWVAIACSVQNAPSTPCDKIRAYELLPASSLSNATDYERHAMALESLGINPYSGTPVDYITPIVNKFDGTKIDGPVQADVFALFPLLHAGFSPSDPMIQKIGTYILSQQQPNGSWGDPDTTAAAIQSLGMLFGADQSFNAKLGQALGAGQGFLISTQQSNGGWGNVDSTSWVQTMVNSVLEGDPSNNHIGANSAGLLPMDSIVNSQRPDGGMDNGSTNLLTRAWSTSYAVVAASGKSWITLLHSFSKPTPTTPARTGSGTGGGQVLGAATSTVAATTTIPVATSTSPIATSTEPIATSTAPIATSTIATTTSTSTATSSPPKSKIKKKTPPLAPAELTPVATEVTATTSEDVTVSQNGGFLGNLWSAIVSFFAKLF